VTSPKNVAVLGATGSIGRAGLEVIAAHPDRFRAWAVVAQSRGTEIASLARACGALHVGLADEVAHDALAREWRGPGKLHGGTDAICALVAHPEVDVVLVGVAGAAGLAPTLAAARAGKRIALANKESMVMAGPIVRAICRATGAELIPVDSEHSAIFQALQCGRRADVKKVILTASGGALKAKTQAELEHVTPADALKHPTWSMGAKITIDSASLINKALEVVEARWLFDLEPTAIDVVVHPQSIVHSMVEFQDGAVIAQMSRPDMKLPIQYAFSHPERLGGLDVGFDLAAYRRLDFEAPDLARFPGLGLGFEAIRAGGTMGAVLNAANEVAVARFLAGALRFPRIAAGVEKTMARHRTVRDPDLPQVLDADAWAREEVLRCLA